MTTRAHRRSHTFRPIHNAFALIRDLVKFALVSYGAGALSMLTLVLYYHI